MRYYTFAGGWSYNDDCDAYLAYLKIELLSVVLCRDEIIKHYGRYLHNLACGVATGGCFYNVIMPTIFYFSIFDIDRVS